MPDAALVVRTRTELARRVAEWPETDTALGTSWALVLVHEIPTASDIAAMREAAKICDRVACVRPLPDKVIPPRLAEVLGDAGVDVLWVPAALVGAGRVKGAGDETLATFMLQALLAVLPLAVVLPKGETTWAGTLKGLYESFGEVSPLRIV